MSWYSISTLTWILIWFRRISITNYKFNSDLFTKYIPSLSVSKSEYVDGFISICWSYDIEWDLYGTFWLDISYIKAGIILGIKTFSNKNKASSTRDWMHSTVSDSLTYIYFFSIICSDYSNLTLHRSVKFTLSVFMDMATHLGQILFQLFSHYK